MKRNDLWKTISRHGVNSGFIQALKFLYKDSSAYVRINEAYTDWSPWLLNQFMDSCLYDLKEYEYGLRMCELSIKCLLYADDQVILPPLSCRLDEMVS
ncbi:hypothetical protein EVAR_61542_1 [Eumeta japonica]|uniref:Reverse transcriptase domain-containing protein n=1 Tax=Eumeta variegata TaxID=151549 RepID=A0A4C1ZCJ3_EUMVA|nr:hypothetical protein EVAR_61542_1 [Eumeta japonica]